MRNHRFSILSSMRNCGMGKQRRLAVVQMPVGQQFQHIGIVRPVDCRRSLARRSASGDQGSVDHTEEMIPAASACDRHSFAVARHAAPAAHGYAFDDIVSTSHVSAARFVTRMRLLFCPHPRAGWVQRNVRAIAADIENKAALKTGLRCRAGLHERSRENTNSSPQY
jgi:hypothetical protein